MSVPVINGQHFPQQPNALGKPGATVIPTVTMNPPGSDQNEMNLHDILAILGRRKWTILLTLLLTVLGALAYTYSSRPTYRADATIQIERKSAEIVPFGKTESISDTFDSLNDPFFRTRYEMLKSRLLAQKVIDELDLQKTLAPPVEPSVFSLAGIRQMLGVGKEESAEKKPMPYTDIFLKDLFIQPIEKTHLVEIYYESVSPTVAKDVVASLIDNFIKLQIETKSETGEYAKNFLAQQLKDARQRLKASEEALVKYSNEKDILGIDPQQTRHVKKLEELNTALVQAEIRRTEAESLYREMQKSGSVSVVLNNPVLVSLKSRLVDLEGKYQEMLKTFKPNYPDMQRLQRQISDARQKLKREKSTIESSLRSDYLAARRQENKIRSDLKRFNKQLQNWQDSSIDYNTLKRAVDTSGQTYNSLLQRLEEVNVATAATTSNIRIVDPVVEPHKRYRPNPKVNLMLGMLSGLILGLGFAFLREALDRSIKSSDDLQRQTGLPVLGLIPPAARGAVKKSLPKIAFKMPGTPVSEGYRILSANIRYLAGEPNERIMLVTSANPNEGKTTTASNIACSYAQMGKKVLLIDADLRKPSLHQRLALGNESGLCDFLAGEDDLVGITQPVKDVPGLYVITSGNQKSDPVRLLSHERMAYLTTQAATRFDYVIIDSPPVRGFADTLILTSLASSTLIVAQENKLESRGIRQVLEQLMRVRNNVIGFLLVNAQNPAVDARLYNKHYGKSRKKQLAAQKPSLAHVTS